MNIKVGDKVVRMLAGTIPMPLVVTDVTDKLIICGDYTFDKLTGAEIDDYFGFGPPPKYTCSVLRYTN